MLLRRFALAALVCLVAACPGATPPPAQPANAPPATSATTATTAPAAERATVVGKWREFWGLPDVEYHDEYQIGFDGDRPFVLALSEDHSQEIDGVSIDGDKVKLTVHTSFAVNYDLHLDPGGASMSGIAVTPDNTVKIRWERIAD